MGLYFPGTETYSSGSHSQQDILIWLIIYSITYTITPLFWLQRKGLYIEKLFTSLIVGIYTFYKIHISYNDLA